MPSGKKVRYDKDDLRLARYAKALGHPARIAILRYLSSVSSCPFNEISRELPLAGSTVSQHLTELKSAGLITGTYESAGVRYCIDHERFKAVRKMLKDFARMKETGEKINL
jgi:DNA-binding transcriptional ArsR family regulator